MVTYRPPFERSEEDLMREGLYSPGSFDQSLNQRIVTSVRAYLDTDHRGRPVDLPIVGQLPRWDMPERDPCMPTLTVMRFELDRAYHHGKYDTTEWWVAFNEFDQWVAADKVTVRDNWDDNKLYYAGGNGPL